MASPFVLNMSGLFGGSGSITGTSGKGSITGSNTTSNNVITGLKGFFGKTGVVGVLLNQSLEVLKKIKGTLEGSSGAFKATMMIWKQAMRLFFKPFADFLSSILRPLGLGFLKLMIRWNKWLDVQFGETEAQKTTDDIVDEIEKREGRKVSAEEERQILKDQIQKQGGATFSDSIELIKLALKREWEQLNLKENWEELKTKLSEQFGPLWDAFREGWDVVKEKLSEQWEELSSAFSEGWEELKTKLSEQWIAFSSVFSEGWEELKTKLSEQWENSVAIVKGAFEILRDKLTGIWDEVKEGIKGAFSTLADKIKELNPFSRSSGGRAEGGVITSRRTITVGERGPEAIIPLNGRTTLGGNSLRIENVTINNPIINDDQNIEMQAEKLMEVLIEKMSRRSSFGR